MRHLLTTLIIATLCATSLVAQNRIDHFVNTKSTMGPSKFTSVVERDPHSHDVVRVVRTRTLNSSLDIREAERRFIAERDNGNFSHEVTADNCHTLLLVVEAQHQNRVYMLQYQGADTRSAHHGKVTIVQRFKQE